MITERTFAETVANWMEQTILPPIPETKTFMRATLLTFIDVVRLRPTILTNIIDTQIPALKMFGILKDGKVDTELLRTALNRFFATVKTIDIKDYVPNFSYTLSHDEIEPLCRALAGAEGASSLLDGGIKNV